MITFILYIFLIFILMYFGTKEENEDRIRMELFLFDSNEAIVVREK